MLTVEGTMNDDINPDIQGQYFDQDLQYLLNQIDPVEFDPNQHDEIVIFSTRAHLHHRRLYPLIAARLCQKDIPCYFLFYHEQIARTFPDLTLKNVQVSNSFREQEEGVLYRSGQIGYPRLDWNVDIPERRIEVDGIDDVNFFPTFHSTLQKELKRYNVDYTDPDVIRKIQRGLFTADEVLRYCQLYINFAVRHDINIRFVAWEYLYLPHGLFYMFSKSEKNIENRFQYINIGTQYANYFGGREDFPYNIGSANLTLRESKRPYGGYKDQFEDLYQRVRSSESLRKSIEEEMLSDLRENILGSVDEAVNLSSEMSAKLKNRIEQTHDSNNNVFCLFSHQFYDIPLEDEGPFSESMCEWIDQTLELFKDRDDLLLLKPHPSETQMPNEEWAPDETLAEYIGDSIKGHENIIYMDPDALDSIAVYQQIDCGLVWRSSVGIEMMALGVPMIVSGIPYWLEYLNPVRARSFSEYEHLVDDVDQVDIDARDQTRAVVYLYFFKNFIHYFIPYIKNLNYSNLDPRKVRWDREKVDDLLDGTSPNIDALIDEMNLEGFKPDFSLEDKLTEYYDDSLHNELEL